MRVVSLVPSLTETLITLGVMPIACTRFCEQPSIASVGGTKDPSIEAIVALGPDVVFLDREENRREDADALRAAGVEVFATHVASIADVAEMIASVAERLGVASIDVSHQNLAVRSVRTAFVPIWRRPWMTINALTYASSLLESIGIANVFANDAAVYPTMTLADAAALSPQMVLLPSEPYPFAPRHISEVGAALPDAEIHFVDGQDLFWWGVRTPLARQRLAAALAT